MKSTARGTLAVLALGTALVASGCGSTNNTAAVVGGDKIAESDLQAAVEQINSQFQLDTPVTAPEALYQLILAGPAIDLATAHKTPIDSAAAARSKFTKIDDPNPVAVQLLRANQALSSLDASSANDLIMQFSRLKVSVNPRYGTFDVRKGVQQTTPSWITSATPIAQPATQ